MEAKQRIIHPEQASKNHSLRQAQQRLYDQDWCHDVEFYVNGELVAITSRENPNIDRLATALEDGGPIIRSDR